MKERIFHLRKELLGLSRAKFGEPIGMTDSEIKNIEYGYTELKENKIALICAKYDVNENWLRTGEGTPLRQKTWQEEVAKYVGEVLTSQGAGAELQQMILEFFAKIPQDMWDELAEKAKAVLEDHSEK